MIQETTIGEGYVQLLDVFGDEHTICEAARVSYGEGTKSVSDDTTLIRYLMRHRHTTPFEQVEFRFRVQVPMDTWRQWIRHRMANVNEYSTRYSEAIDLCAKVSEWRLQDTQNNQGSGPRALDQWPEGYDPHENETPGSYLSMRELELHELSAAVYNERLLFGIAREQARKDLPLSTYTRAYWKIDLHNLLHFLSLRMDSHAQLEIRTYANAIGAMVATQLPNVWAAFIDYRLESVTLTRLEAFVIANYESFGRIELDVFTNNRERAECEAKLRRLRIS